MVVAVAQIQMWQEERGHLVAVDLAPLLPEE
jgi:hypothetical protein